jgi:fructose-bisphosphate aldolase, class I
MNRNELGEIARAMVAKGKGILAADESGGTIKKRFDTIKLESTEEARRTYRELLFTANGMQNHISGVILYDETIRQSSADRTPFPELLTENGMIPGIKVDLGAKPLAFSPEETVTEGLDGLRERLQEYVGLGARFTKWRAVITIGEGIPTEYCLRVNAHALGRFAALSQDAGLVPIVEPEVLMDGDHTIERCYDVTKETLYHVFRELHQQRIQLDGALLKPNMVISGKDAPDQASADRVAELTLKAFHETVPAAIGGIVFLSGGQSDQQASENLNAINAQGPQPWKLSYSYGRALQAPALQAWRGDPANVELGQQMLLHRARLNSAAAGGRYTIDMEELARAS